MKVKKLPAKKSPQSSKLQHTKEDRTPKPSFVRKLKPSFVHKLKSGLRTQTQGGASYARTQVGASYAHRTSQHPNTRETEHPSFTASNRRGFVRKLKSGLRTQTQVGASYAMFMSGSDFIHPDDCEVLTAAQDSRLPPDMTYAVPPARARGSLHQLALSARARWALHQPLLPLLPLPLLPLPASPATTHNFVRLSVSKLLLTGAASAVRCSLLFGTILKIKLKDKIQTVLVCSVGVQ